MKISQDALDREFRLVARGLLSSASESIYILENNLSSLMFLDIQNPLYKRKEHVRAYAYTHDDTRKTLMNFSESIGIQTYYGPLRLGKNYIVVDRNDVIEFQNTGLPDEKSIPRSGDVYADHPLKAREIISLFDKMRNASKRWEIDITLDPMYQFLHSQPTKS